MQIFKQNQQQLQQKKVVKEGVGQIMRGDEAKKLYAAEVNYRYDTVEGFNNKNKQKTSVFNITNYFANSTNSTSNRPKRKEITILTSSPKSNSHNFYSQI